MKTIIYTTLLFASSVASAFAANCSIGSGLDPACPLTQAGTTYSSTSLNATAQQANATAFASLAWHTNQQFSFSFPAYDSLRIAGVGNAYGTGDMSLGYERVVAAHKRLSQVVGLTISLPTGATAFSAGSTALAPSYALSYALGSHIELVTLAQYTFDAGGTKLPFAPRTQAFTLIPRAIVRLAPFGFYGALDIAGSNITGDERYQAYRANATLGIARRHTAFSVAYGLPIARFTRENVFYNTFTAQFAWRQ